MKTKNFFTLILLSFFSITVCYAMLDAMQGAGEPMTPEGIQNQGHVAIEIDESINITESSIEGVCGTLLPVGNCAQLSTAMLNQHGHALTKKFLRHRRVGKALRRNPFFMMNVKNNSTVPIRVSPRSLEISSGSSGTGPTDLNLAVSNLSEVMSGIQSDGLFGGLMKKFSSYIAIGGGGVPIIYSIFDDIIKDPKSFFESDQGRQLTGFAITAIIMGIALLWQNKSIHKSDVRRFEEGRDLLVDLLTQSQPQSYRAIDGSGGEILEADRSRSFAVPVTRESFDSLTSDNRTFRVFKLNVEAVEGEEE